MSELGRFAIDPVLIAGALAGLALCLVYLVRMAPRDRQLADAIRLLVASLGVAVGGRIIGSENRFSFPCQSNGRAANAFPVRIFFMAWLKEP
ncbi:MAG: hypothetical protein HYW07_09120 [Candidatus Latescibacteria bacterium]|nr:hypothetical protein [Candidatus Latescibacterota bacterium]